MEESMHIMREPSERDLRESGMALFMAWLRDEHQLAFDSYQALHQWSIDKQEQFWGLLADYSGMRFHQRGARVLTTEDMPDAKWFPESTLNFAENILQGVVDGDAERVVITAYVEDEEPQQISADLLIKQVAAFQQYLNQHGVVPGDRVAAVVANGVEAIVGMLATTSVGAVWSSVSPEYGVTAILDRFGQIHPRILIVTNAYRFGGTVFPRIQEMLEVRGALESVVGSVMIQQIADVSLPAEFDRWDDIIELDEPVELEYVSTPFDHPVYILYSSGTTGVPKCLVHGAGGVFLQHYRDLVLHGDLKAGDSLFYHTTTSWMMWNWMVSTLLTGARLVIYDGSPKYPNFNFMWYLVAQEELTHFGTSAKFIANCRNERMQPNQSANFEKLRVVFSTGSPLAPSDFDWIYAEVKADLLLASISGGTDIVSCFVGGNPILPVRRGAIQCRVLGTAATAFDDYGVEVIGECGELVCTKPIPSMPIYFWNDPENTKYTEAYFAKYPGVWAHGDYVTFYDDGCCVIHGRSDATLNPGGVRIGTAEIYREVEKLDEIADSIVVSQQVDSDVMVVLFVVLNPGFELTDELINKIREQVRGGASPRHVPERIYPVGEVPYTHSGKKVEIAVHKMLHNIPVENRGALANPWALDQFVFYAGF